MALHEAAMKDDYFVSRKLGPNVDFWSVLHSCFRMIVVLITSSTGGKLCCQIIHADVAC
jgi:hypothetical protein